MSQKARSHQGFGFQTSGGYDEKKPLVVSSVKAGNNEMDLPLLAIATQICLIVLDGKLSRISIQSLLFDTEQSKRFIYVLVKSKLADTIYGQSQRRLCRNYR